jgi:hypothetical protein
VLAVSAVAKVLDRLERVRQTAQRRWRAKCPAHDSRSQSLSIRELDDGRVLLHDFGGCPTSDVLAAMGLSLSDLFEKPLGDFQSSHSRIPARELLEIISKEATVVGLVAADILEHRAISEADWVRLATAAGRIGSARDHVHGD